MKKLKLFFAAGIVLLMASCGNNSKPVELKAPANAPPKEPYIEQIKSLEAAMHNSKEISNDTANIAIKAYSEYAMFFPNDTIAPYYLFKAGEVATASKKYKQALVFYETITSKYPEFKHVKESLYLQGFLLDNFMNDDVAAKKIYEQVIDKYPSTNYANDAKAAINNLGKTDEQLIQEFKKKNEKK